MELVLFFVFFLLVVWPLVFAIAAQRRGHIGFIWFACVLALNVAFCYFVNNNVVNDPAFRFDPNFMEKTGKYRELGGYILLSVISPLIVSVILFTWPRKNK